MLKKKGWGFNLGQEEGKDPVAKEKERDEDCISQDRLDEIEVTF